MHQPCRPRGITKLLLAGMLALSWSADAATRNFEFLYINASEGSASGGHAAIKFDHEVFHFQHVDPGLLRIHRDDFSAFRFAYGYQENRTIQGHRIEVDANVFQTLRDAFNRRLLIQNQQFALLKAFQDDRQLLNDLKQMAAKNPEQVAPVTIELKALGYFVSDFQFDAENENLQSDTLPKSTSLAQLRQAVAGVYGDNFLRQKRQQAWARQQTLKPAISDATVAMTEDRFEPVGYSFAQRYQNQLLNIAAIDVLEAGLAPRTETLVTADLPELHLSAEAISKLTHFKQTLFADLIKLMQSERTDWGYPLLVGMARLHALQLSIQSQQLVVLDRFQAGDHNNKTVSVDADNLAAVREFADDSFSAAIKRLLEPAELNERDYGKIEVRTGTLLKIHAAAQSKQSFRLPAIDSTPSRIARAEIVSLPLSATELNYYDRLLTARLQAYRDKLESLYPYDLLHRNCVTDIFRVINDSIVQQADTDNTAPEPIWQTSQRLLGGYIDDQRLNVIPFAAFDQVGSAYRLDSSYRLPPYREQEIEQQHRSNDGILVDMAESNTITSSIYHWHGEDAAFVFFTQDAVWPRPLLGGINLTVAIGQTLYGLLALPWDAGQNLQKSLKGIFVSVPELFFFNIRKGSFPQLIPATVTVSSKKE